MKLEKSEGQHAACLKLRTALEQQESQSVDQQYECRVLADQQASGGRRESKKYHHQQADIGVDSGILGECETNLSMGIEQQRYEYKEADRC